MVQATLFRLRLKHLLLLFLLVVWVHGIPAVAFLVSPSNATRKEEQGAEEGNLWCVARYGTDPVTLQAALEWACGPGKADCSLIQPGASCYAPNTLFAHACFAFNSYFYNNMRAPQSCDFRGAAVLINVDPSYPGCSYTSSAGQKASASSASEYSAATVREACSVFFQGLSVLVVAAMAERRLLQWLV